MTELPKAPIKRIAKQEGVERIIEDAEQGLTEAVEEYTRKLSVAIRDSANHAGRKTVQIEDVEFVLEHF